METRSLLFAVCCLLCVDPAFALALDAALVSADKNCGGVYEEIGRLKKMAGINTVVTGIGTAAGVGAVATGFAGSRKMDRLLAKLKEAEKENPARPTREELEELNADIEALYAESSVDEQTPALQTDETKRLGNVRTGLMATGAAINAAGAVMAANGGPKNLKDMIAGCRGALLVLDSELTRLRVANEADANDPKFARAEKIVAECGRLSEINVAKIDQKANVVKLAAGAGAAMAIAGAITSALANSDKTNRTDGARKNLDSASNALAVGMTAASGVSTGFNAALIAEYDKALKTAEKCGETLE